MLRIINNKIYIVRGDDEVLDLELSLSGGDGSAYELAEGEWLTLTVRELPSAHSPVLLAVNSLPGSRRIVLRGEDTQGMEYGSYSADIQLTHADGRRETVWPTEMGGNRLKVRNLKNFNVASEVTIT